MLNSWKNLVYILLIVICVSAANTENFMGQP